LFEAAEVYSAGEELIVHLAEHAGLDRNNIKLSLLTDCTA